MSPDRPSAGVWTNAQTKALIRAMHSFCGKSNRYALTGGQGRRHLYLYEIGDPVSAMWAKMNVERRSPSPNRVTLQ
jgi:hypothetical protein